MSHLKAGPVSFDELTSELERDAPNPLHDQISALMRLRILSGQWPAHMKLPAEPELARTLDVARGTVRHAVRTLITEGLLIQIRGKGTFVRSQLLEQTFAQEVVSTAESLDREGVPYVTRVLSCRIVPAPGAIRAQLALDDDASVLAIRRVRSVEGQIVYLLENYVPVVWCPGFDSQRLTERTLFSILEEDYGIVIGSVRRTFAAQLPGHDVAEVMSHPTTSPVIYLEQISYTRTMEPVEYSDVWMRGDRVNISSWLRRH